MAGLRDLCYGTDLYFEHDRKAAMLVISHRHITEPLCFGFVACISNIFQMMTSQHHYHAIASHSKYLVQLLPVLVASGHDECMNMMYVNMMHRLLVS